jgi:DNA-binding Xre family transcriptional regulator
MSFRTEADTGIGDGARAATLMGGKAATRPVRSAIGRLQRVRAFMRVTRRAIGSTCGRREWTGGAVWLNPYGSRREPVTLLFDAGGPGPLTEDRQKPRRLLDGMHGTRNTVPSRAARPSGEPRGGGLEPNLAIAADPLARAPGLNPRGTLEWVVDVTAIDRARILRGWTRRDLAQHARVDEGTLCDLCAGRRRPTFGTLGAICQALDLTLDDVIAFSEARHGDHDCSTALPTAQLRS